MKLELIKTSTLPFARYEKSIWVSEKESSFYLSDIWHITRINITDLFSENVLYKAPTEEAAYSMRGIYDKRLPDPLYDEISSQGFSGFRLLSKREYDQMDVNAGSISYLDYANRLGPVAQFLPISTAQNILFTFGSKSISMYRFQENTLQEFGKIKTKGKTLGQVYLHPCEDLIFYGTNYSEIYGQHFRVDGFGKSVKIDDLQKPLYQINFAGDGKYLIVAGMGYLTFYEYTMNAFAPVHTIHTSTRSFEIMNNYLILNKGMHGIEIYDMAAHFKKIAHLEIPFAIDRMVLNKTEKVLLAISTPAGSMGFIKIST
ncbi:hypothetical protein [Dyadobacter sp. CY323]|uniref:hypothetical protein n=1 Tax=Dyadobacter sp. CY323 TaxID=2907302 RepID=UPI001F49080A|nr:hypothetical protein [Dyadobacter sp. CY323]MCE6987775.1 hypothetical protein [Dyadobacter sp. CY323]